MGSLLKIAVTGPESTGKSWLTARLAAHFRAPAVPEFARLYIDLLDRAYRQEDIVRIARGQLALEMTLEAAATQWLFCDTEALVTKIWSLHKYGSCDPFILETIQTRSYDLYLLCDVDLPWVPDKQREHPHLRRHFFSWYERELQEQGFPYQVIRGEQEKRLQAAIQAVNELLASIPSNS